ncbi:hypothetical protein FAES_1438 [Fibrella aestuarina BUZ 2]|uniref:Uncharacterized protein n=1 Tax=Fibrella aestuarina BUZ 2 TaxID=1166018 RepID=I0K5P5_9BACT|nr:hypothetical protein [Fibrella aestuarina]CCG99448.1 hypothetical protein FAES_1438 [Fibrella aestuarina BUZ 2]
MKPNLLLFLLVAASTATVAQTRQMAKPGEEVHVWAYPVKAGKQKQYEHFVHDIFWPGAKKLPAAGQRVFRQTRVLHPTRANADGTYTYLFIMDPYIKGEDYDIESLVKKMYGAKQGAAHYKLFADAVVSGKDVGYRVTQSNE